MNLYRTIRNRSRLKKRYKKRRDRLEKSVQFQVKEIDGMKLVEINDLRLVHIFDGDGSLIAEEIFLKDEYNFDISEPVVVIDVGMNIGLASLYFASRDDVMKVYGFEPFKSTFEHAKDNFELNERQSSKITAFNYGLGCEEKELSFDYYSKAPGRMSTVKSLEEIPHNPKYKTDPVNVQIKDAGTEISEIIGKHPESKFVLKCDTEGSEVEIFESLDAKGILNKIEVIMLEFHFSYDVFITEILKRNGFGLFKQKTVTLDSGDFGMIRAVKMTQ